MPDTRIKRPYPALAAQVDARAIAGTALFTRVDDVDVNVATLSTDARIYWDLPAFLHGYGSSMSAALGDIFATNWGGPGELTVGIGTDDLFFIRSKDVGIELKASASNEMFGLNPAGQVSVIDNGEYLIKALNPWRRGVFEVPAAIELEDVDSGVVYTVLDDYPRVQSLPTWLRSRGTLSGDADDVWSGLTVEDADPQNEAHWLVEPDGRVTVSYLEQDGFLLGTNLDFWRMIGGTGEEQPTDGNGTRKKLTTTFRAPSFLALDRQYVSLRRFIKTRSEGVTMTSGAIVTSSVPAIRGWDLEVRVTGPAYGPTLDQERHLRLWWTRATRALTFYPQWGDMDHAEGSIDLRRHVSLTETQSHERYSHQRTAEADIEGSHWGKRRGGRLMLRRDPGDEPTHAEKYEHSLDVFQDIRLRLLDRVD